MMTIDNRLRDALRDLGNQVTAGTQRPLRLPVREPDRDGVCTAAAFDAEPLAAAREAGHPAQHRRWLAPAGAAASLVAIAGAIAVISAPSQGRPARHQVSALPGNVPPYYVALELRRGRCCGPEMRAAVVTETATGRALAAVTPPSPYTQFVAVSGAADDRTFVLAAQRRPRVRNGYPVYPATKFFRLTIVPAAPRGKRVTLTPLPAPAEPRGVLLRAMELSPQGSKLAVSTTDVPAHASTQSPLSRLSVVDIASGAERTWYQRGFAWTSLSWEGDSRTLALFAAARVSFRWTVALLDTASPGSVPQIARNFTSPARVLLRGEALTPDGRTVLAVLQVPHAEVRYPWTGYDHLDSFSLRTGKLTGTADVREVRVGESDQVLWSSSSGRVLLMSFFPRRLQTGPGIHTERAAAILIDGRVTRIPWSRYAITAAW